MNKLQKAPNHEFRAVSGSIGCPHLAQSDQKQSDAEKQGKLARNLILEAVQQKLDSLSLLVGEYWLFLVSTW
jgi:hypothetical protein